MTALEIAVTSVVGAGIARDEGADRIELCSALELGGVTPSIGLLDDVCEAFPGAVHVLVRPRPGDFLYDAAEARVVELDIREALRRGAAGVVVGALTSAGEVDIALVRRWADAARECRPEAVVTLHRAVDHARDHLAAVESVVGIVDRVLTSGGAPTAREGLAALAAAKQAVGDQLEVMAGGGVRPEDLPALAAVVDAIHLSAKRSVSSGAGVALGIDDDGSHPVTDRDTVRTAVRALR